MPNASDRCRAIEFINNKCLVPHVVLQSLLPLRTDMQATRSGVDPVLKLVLVVSSLVPSLLRKVEYYLSQSDLKQASMYVECINDMVRGLGKEFLKSKIEGCPPSEALDEAAAICVRLYAGLYIGSEKEPQARDMSAIAAAHVYQEMLDAGNDPDSWMARRLVRVFGMYCNPQDNFLGRLKLLQALYKGFHFGERSIQTEEILSELFSEFARDSMRTAEELVDRVKQMVQTMRTEKYEPPIELCAKYIREFATASLIRAVRTALVFYAAALYDLDNECTIYRNALLVADSLFARSLLSEASIYLDSIQEQLAIARGPVDE